MIGSRPAATGRVDRFTALILTALAGAPVDDDDEDDDDEGDDDDDGALVPGPGPIWNACQCS